ncbi:MAG: hypothetical protein ACRD0W_00230 [Acidimicrobiales bacterium]
MRDPALRPSFRRFAMLTGVKLLALAAVAVPVLTALPYGVDIRPADTAPLSVRDQHRAVAVHSYGVSHGCRAAEPYPPVAEQRSALVEDAPGMIRLVGIDEGRAVLSGTAPGTLLAVCERAIT